VEEITVQPDNQNFFIEQNLVGKYNLAGIQPESISFMWELYYNYFTGTREKVTH